MILCSLLQGLHVCISLHMHIALRVHIAISKNVVRENDECQLSNGDYTTEKKCGIEY